MDGISTKEFYDQFVSQGCACLLIEKIGVFDLGTYVEGILYSPGGVFNHENLQIHSRHGKVIEFKHQHLTCEADSVPLYFNKAEKRFVDLSDEGVEFDRNLFDTKFSCRKGSVILRDIFLSNIFKGCVLVSKNWM